MDITLDMPARYIPHVGPTMSSRLSRLGIETVHDFLYHIPSRFDDFSLITSIARVQPGQTVTVRGTIDRFGSFFTKSGKKIQEAKVSDASGSLSVIWFNQPYLRTVIMPGESIALSGPIAWFGTKLVMNSPQFEMGEKEPGISLHTGRLVPVYPETEGVTSKWMRTRIAFLLQQLLPSVRETLPDSLRDTYNLMGLSDALHAAHFPKNTQESSRALHRIAFDEMLLMHLRSYTEKKKWTETQKSIPMKGYDPLIDTLIASLPFVLTQDQIIAINEIRSDLKATVPMNRILIGDVGSGKTVVAAIAMYLVAQNKRTSALLAPTQILAQQHYQTVSQLLEPLGVSVGLITGESKSSGVPYDILIGTHALLSKKLRIPKLALVVIDEQHRFGVEQRAILTARNKQGKTPHSLMMTATPIPRTMAKTMLGSTDVSILSQAPKGRQTIKTWVVPKTKRESAYKWIGEQVHKTEGQVFIICPLIEESETLTTVKAVTGEVERIRKRFPTLEVGLLHGRLKPAEKTSVLQDFKNKRYSILVATPVVEVGIDIPNATIMIIETAERFGLGQLHQMRGRVGRGNLQSYCLLFTEQEDERPLTRLKALETVHSGPMLADIDLSFRGPGEVFGTRQHGLPLFKVASFSDIQLIKDTQEALNTLNLESWDLSLFPLLRDTLKKGTI